MTDSGSDIDFMKSKLNELFSKLPPDLRQVARESINVIREAKTIEERDMLRDQEIKKGRRA